MSTLVSFVNEVEDAVSSGDPVRRVASLRRMTDLFMEQAAHLGDLHVAVFDEVILRLSRDLEFRARLELSERLADIANAPPQVVRDLAFDENIAVAGPVLERSPRLAEDDLVQVARGRGQDHLFALSRRPALTERITDILVDRGDARVVRSVAGNGSARFSDQGLGQLLEHARRDATLQGILRARCDIPPAQMARLVEIARARVRGTLREEFGHLDRDVLDETLDEAAGGLALQGRSKALLDNFDEAVVAVRDRARETGLSEDDVLEWVQEGRLEEALAAMAQMGNLPVEMVARAYHSTHYDPLLFIVRSLRFGWATFNLLLAAKAGRQPPVEVTRGAHAAFQKLTVQTAQKVVRFTVVRERAMQPNAA